MTRLGVIVDWSAIRHRDLDDDLIDLWRAVEQVDGIAAADLAATATSFIQTHAAQALRLIDVVGEVDAVHDIDVGATIMTIAQHQPLEVWAPSLRHDPDRVQALGELDALGMCIGIITDSVWSRTWITQFLDRDAVPYSALIVANEGNWGLTHGDAWAEAAARVGPGVVIGARAQHMSAARQHGFEPVDWDWVAAQYQRT